MEKTTKLNTLVLPDKVLQEIERQQAQLNEVIREGQIQLQKYLEGVIDMHPDVIDGVEYQYNPDTQTLDPCTK